MNPWQVAFVVLQIIFTIVLAGFLVILRLFYKDMKIMDVRISKLEQRQSIDDVQYQFIREQLAKITKDIEKIFKLITKRR